MTSEFNTLFASHAFPKLQSQFGEAVTHLLSDGTEAAFTGAIWEEHEPEETRDRGHGTKRMGVLTISDAVTVAVGDRFTIRGETWSVTTIREQGGGFIDVDLVLQSQEFTHGRSRRTI